MRRHSCFSRELAVVTVSLPVDASDADRESYHLAHHQCVLHTVSSPPREFSFTSSGSISAPSIEVSVRQSLVDKLPLFQDISSVTEATEDKYAGKGLPCSVWSLASLLLLEGRVTVHLKQLFDSGKAESHPGLAAKTLQVLTQPLVKH